MRRTLNTRSPASFTVFTGTKAQFIKMVPVILEFERRGWPYRIIDTGQHANLVRHIIKDFGLRDPDICLDEAGKGVSTLAGGLYWMGRILSLCLRSPRRLRAELFAGQTGVCLVHGDTVSTLLATLLAKRARQKVAHVEAGLRSWNLLHPFPEELIRVAVTRLGHCLLAPSAAAMENLTRMGLSHNAYLLPGNTNRDTLRLTLGRDAGALPELPARYALASVHRLETVFSRRRLDRVVQFLVKASRMVHVVFVQHPPTERRLKCRGLDRVLADAGISTLPLLSHSGFVRLMSKASFVLTDGGSVQEEASYLGVPCLLLRKATERDDGIGRNVVLSRMDDRLVTDFLDNVEAYRREPDVDRTPSPSAVIADVFEGLVPRG